MSTYNLALRGLAIVDLRKLAHRYLEELSFEAIETLDKLSLISALSSFASGNNKLAQEMRKSSISMKPSFYLMVLAPLGKIGITKKDAKKHINTHFLTNGPPLADTSDSSPYKGFAVEEIIEHKKGIIELRFTWQRAIWFWEPLKVSLEHVYELRYGFAVLNLEARKAIIACHTEHERKVISDAICKAYPIKLSPLVLTPPVLNQIGSFDRVRRAGYFISDPEQSVPANITYADEQLSAKFIARDEEQNPRSVRKYSYYLIPLGSIIEQGIGATSDSGKLWLPRQLPLDTVRDYAVELLDKIGDTLDDLTERKEYSTVLKSLGVTSLPRLSTIRVKNLRQQI